MPFNTKSRYHWKITRCQSEKQHSICIRTRIPYRRSFQKNGNKKTPGVNFTKNVESDRSKKASTFLTWKKLRLNSKNNLAFWFCHCEKKFLRHSLSFSSLWPQSLEQWFSSFWGASPGWQQFFQLLSLSKLFKGVPLVICHSFLDNDY